MEREKEVYMYVCIRYSSEDEDRQMGLIVMEYMGNVKEVFVKDMTERSSNRYMLRVASEGLKMIKQPCIVNLFFQTNPGIKYMKTMKGKWTNRDVGNLIVEEAFRKSIKLNFYHNQSEDMDIDEYERKYEYMKNKLAKEIDSLN